MRVSINDDRIVIFERTIHLIRPISFQSDSRFCRKLQTYLIEEKWTSKYGLGLSVFQFFCYF